jgi:UMF1 family MFS transporter
MQNDTTVQQPPFERNNKRVINGWAFFDWANSSYSLVIAAAIFPGYYTANTNPIINIGGWEVPNTALYSYAVTVAYLLIALLSPTLSGIADYGGKKMLFLKIFTTIGATACIALFWFNGMGTIVVGLLGFILATAGFAGGLVFYNAYLPQIATEDQYDHVSAKGFSFGYIGSVILLIINLLIILNPKFFGLPEGDSGAKLGAQISFIMVGIWWLGFARIPFRRLPKDTEGDMPEDVGEKGWQELKSVWAIVRKSPNVLRFLISFLCYNAGVQTVLFMASIFATAVLNFKTSELIVLILILQLVAAIGAHVFAWVSKLKGNKFALMVMLVTWVAICILAFLIQEKLPFYMLGGLVGFVMGGIQSLSRSTYAKLLPENIKDTTSFFSFMDVMDKISVVIGTFAFGIVNQIMGDIRFSVLALMVFFIIGIIILISIKIEKSKA